ncbi:MAG: sulfurtransferase TusA family protein [Desulfurococcales archaeon]|nr:sulfurtransferase TusA family protein [Desulfurococcales archaeon]
MAVKRLDLRGAECPKPLYEVARTIRESRAGDLIEILVDSKECEEMIVDMVTAVDAGRVEKDAKPESTVIKIYVK